MILQVLRALFVFLMACVGWFYISNQGALGGVNSWFVLPITLTLGVLFVCIDILSPRAKLAFFSGTVLGLVVGLALAYALGFAVQFLIDQYREVNPRVMNNNQYVQLATFCKVLVGVVCCYLSISFVLQTKDDFRLIIPYVEFAKQAKGPKPILLDTSALIDGRVADVAATGALEERIIVPQFILEELQAVADSADKLKRNRGRGGLDVLAKLRANPEIDVILYESPSLQESDVAVDQKLMRLAKELHGRVVTSDYNLNKVAQLNGVQVLNINDLANSLRPVILPGERLTVRIVRPGEEPGQGIGYLEDGTMVVVEHARNMQGEPVDFTVTRALQTSAGRMVFGRIFDEPTPHMKSPRASTDEATRAS